MKNGKMIFGAICITALASACDSDISDIQHSGNTISLSAVASSTPRSRPTTTATMNQFIVYAFTEGETLMDGVAVTRTGGVWTYSPEAYWPVTPVNFYAFSPDITDSPDIEGMNGGNIPDYLNPGNIDLLYSVRTGVTQQAAPVLLNFRHAMSRVSVMLSSTNQRITVKVSHISLCNIYMQGTFNFPTASTLADAPEVVGNWALLKRLGQSLLFYAISGDDKVTLTHVPTDYTENTLNYSFVIPQPLNNVEFDGNSYTGTYIQVDCEIFDTATGAKLWPNANTPAYILVPGTESGRIVYPTTSVDVREWKPGHAYIYNIDINNPDVLDKIEFDVTVDDFSVDELGML